MKILVLIALLHLHPQYVVVGKHRTVVSGSVPVNSPLTSPIVANAGQPMIANAGNPIVVQ